MTWAGVLAVDLAVLALLLWVLNLVRLGRLYVGYGVLIVMVLVTIGATISLPPLEAIARRVLGTFFLTHEAAVAALGLGFLLIMLVYVLSQITTIANRVATLVQELAIQHVRQNDPASSARPEAGRPDAKRQA